MPSYYSNTAVICKGVILKISRQDSPFFAEKVVISAEMCYTIAN